MHAEVEGREDGDPAVAAVGEPGEQDRDRGGATHCHVRRQGVVAGVGSGRPRGRGAGAWRRRAAPRGPPAGLGAPPLVRATPSSGRGAVGASPSSDVCPTERVLPALHRQALPRPCLSARGRELEAVLTPDRDVMAVAFAPGVQYSVPGAHLR